jgi:hypothetical protein
MASRDAANLEWHDDGTVKSAAKLPKRPDRMGKVSRLQVLNSLGKLVQRERKAVTQHQSVDMGIPVH